MTGELDRREFWRPERGGRALGGRVRFSATKYGRALPVTLIEGDVAPVPQMRHRSDADSLERP